MTAVIFTVFLTDQVQSQDKELCAGSCGIRVDTAGRALYLLQLGKTGNNQS